MPSNVELLQAVANKAVDMFVATQREKQEPLATVVDRLLLSLTGTDDEPETVRNYLVMSLAVAIQRLAEVR
jgi:hypothetical protein